MKFERTLFLALLIGTMMMMIGACAAPAADAPAADNQAEAAADVVDAPLDLPANIDVQTVAEIKERDDVVVLDVREQWEYDEGHIPGVVHLPMNDVPARLDEIPTDKTVVLTCRSGNRSGQVTKYLEENGFDNVHNMQGGIVAWQDAGFDVEQ